MNVLGKATKSARQLALRHLSAPYSLVTANPIFRALRRIWPCDQAAQPILTLAVALARDPLLRGTQHFVSNQAAGTHVLRADMRENVDDAEPRVAAARELKRRLELILEGEKDHDVFVRWRTLAEQPIGWNPDLNDGVQLNIPSFMTAEVLRHNKTRRLNITWDKDRCKDVDSAPWFKVSKGDWINDHHLTLDEKRAARSRA